jgi:CRISPR-associated endonuclease Csn1
MHSVDNRPYRLGLDLGSNSLGWFMVWLDQTGAAAGLGRGGVRIYPGGRDPQSGTSNAADRRVVRGMRRRRDRYLARRGQLMALLVRHGLMPDDESGRKELQALDPYALRAKALVGILPLHHVGRALFHLNQRRGFLSNRKTEKGDEEAGAIREAAGKLEQSMLDADARTLGKFLHDRHRLRPPAPVRARNQGQGNKAEYDFYPIRQMLVREFEAIWQEQAPHHPAMTEAARGEIHHAIFHQRPLKSPPTGKCSLDPATDLADAEGFRCPWAHPLAQRFRIWQEVRNLSVTEVGKMTRTLAEATGNNEAGDKIALALLQNNRLSFDAIRKLLKLPPEARFNIESARRDGLDGDETAAKLSHRRFFGKAWRGLTLDRQIEIVDRLLDEPDETVLIEWLAAETGLDRAAAERVASAFLPEGHSRLGLRAIREILPHMARGLNYPCAAEAAGYDHPLRPTGQVSGDGFLPYYGAWLPDDVVGSGDSREVKERRWGRFPNPTVHIGLGQLRRVVNALIRDYGPPAEITVEMTRSFKLSPKQLAEVEREQAENQGRNDKRKAELLRLGQAVNARNLLKLRLWEELNLHDPLDRRCPFSGDMISIEKLLSEEVEIEHLIPFADSWDDSASNKVVCLRSANRLKGKNTPFEAFKDDPKWPEIAARAIGLPRNKSWRFAPDARKRFGEEDGFQARQLNETGWLARVARQYLSAVTDVYRINVLPGKLTAMIRAKWGLNDLLSDHNIRSGDKRAGNNFSDGKNRKDHRHHAIDAVVAALTDRSLLTRMSKAPEEDRNRIIIPPPWPDLRDDLARALARMTVSHRPDHGLQGQLHEDTAYGPIRPDKEGGNLVYRKTFRDLNEKEIARIRDRRLRDLVQAYVSAELAAGRDLKSALLTFGNRTDIPGLPQGVRHIRLTKTENQAYLVPVHDRSGRVYKAYSAGRNAFVDLFEDGDGKWLGVATSIFQANQPDHRSATPAAARFIMRLFKGDLIALDHEEERRIMVVHRLDVAAGRFKLAGHNETGNLDRRHADPNDPFQWLMASYNTLKKKKAERVRVDELGRVWRVAAAEPD